MAGFTSRQSACASRWSGKFARTPGPLRAPRESTLLAQRSAMYLDRQCHEPVGLCSGASGERAAVDARAHHLRFCVLRVAPG